MWVGKLLPPPCRLSPPLYASLMVTSTSTPGSMEMDVICLTTSAGECRSMRRLCSLRVGGAEEGRVMIDGTVM
jgi:hypothetical protein